MSTISLLSVTTALIACALSRWRPSPRRTLPRPAGPHLRPAPRWVVLAIEEAGVPVDPVTAWRTWRAAGLTVIALMFGAAPILAVMVLIAGAAAPIVLRPILEGRRWHRRDAQLPDVLERLGSELRAGSALGAALAVLGDSTSGPLGEELRSTGVEIRHGAALTTALDHWARMPHASSDVRLAAAALGLGAEAGGEVARSVDRVAATLRERHELRAEVHALATQARASAGVLALAPLGFTALVSTIEPQAVHFLIATPVGVGCLLGGLGLEVAGAAWMARILGSAS